MAKGKKTGGRVVGSLNKSTREVQDLARAYGPAAIEAAARLAGLVKEVVPNKEGDGEIEVAVGMATSEAARLTALQLIIERAYGKATQPHSGPDGEGPLVFTWLDK